MGVLVTLYLLPIIRRKLQQGTHHVKHVTKPSKKRQLIVVLEIPLSVPFQYRAFAHTFV